MKRQNIVYLFIVLIALNLGCSKSYFDINNNPNSATNTTPELVLPNALKVTAAYQLTGYTFLSGWMGYWAPSGSYATSSSDVASYKQTNDSYSGSWYYYYDNLEDYDYVEQQALAQGKPFYAGAAKIMKSYVFQQLVDMYNNVPYFTALKGTSSIQPAYDNGEDVYNAITDQLDSAVALMKSPGAAGDAKSDILFDGNASKWIQFANSLRLRILIRQSQLTDRASYITGEIAKITANGGGFLTEDAGVNPKYAASAGQQNPTWGYFVTLTGNPTSGGAADYWRANQYSLSYLENNADTAREAAIYTSVSGEFLGNVLGSQTNIPGTGSSSFGKGILKSVSQDAIIMTAAESYFLQAEANLRGWLGGGDADANANFKSGVKSSFEYLNAFDTLRIKSIVDPSMDSVVIALTPDSSASKLTSLQGNKNSNYTACTTTAEKLACIIRQKWVANNSITPFEAWCDYRRLGLPSDIPLSISPYKDADNIPLRILYPTGEYQTNAANVGAQGSIDGHTSKVFWMQ